MTKILILEDNKDNLQLMVYLLSKNGYHTITAMDGQQGIECAQKETPDLILCDIQMPVLDGFQVLKSLQKDEDLKKIPIIAVTAYAMVGDREKILAAGFHAYISKPIDPDLFVKEIEQHLPKDLRSTHQLENAKTFQPSEKKKTICKGLALVVDDNLENRELSKNLLETAGFTVKAAASVQKGFEILKTEKPSLILSDFHMPDMTGLDFLKILRNNPEYQHIPFIIISATQPSKHEIIEIRKLHSQGFIDRPIEPADFLNAVNKVYFEKRKVLLVEDNKDNLYLMIYLLTEHGFLPIVATSAEEGINLVQSEKPNLVVCDILLPNQDGHAVANAVKKFDNDIPLLAITALGMKDEIDKILESGFDAYLEKPIDPAVFIHQVESLLQIETEDKKEVVFNTRGKVFVVGKISELVKIPLVNSGFEVVAFKTVAMAQKEMKNIIPDFIVIEGKDVSFIQMIRSASAWKHLPVIVISDMKMLSENPLDQCVPMTVESNTFLKIVENTVRFSTIQQRMDELETTIDQLKENGSLDTLIRTLHNFIGSPIIFGRNDLIQMSRELQQFLKTTVDNKHPLTKQTISEIQSRFDEMKNVYIISNSVIM